jgi:general secretion pathway protein I
VSARGTRGAGSPPGGSRGFTLLEVVVALAILAAGILGLLELLSGSLRLSEGARDLAAAQVYASQRMEEALLSPAPLPGVERGLFGEKYRWEMETAIDPPEEGSRYRRVRFRVTIRWDDGRDERSVQVAAMRWTPEEPGERG